MRILFLGKRDDRHCDQALAFCRRTFPDVAAHLGQFGEPLPSGMVEWQGELIISYLSRWIVPTDLLARVRLAVNFHPAPPEYPGVGCINFALYQEVTSYGVTCHHMAPRVDSGAIIAVRRFPVEPTDGVQSLLERTYDHQLSLFCDVISGMTKGKPLPCASDRWGRHTYTRRELNELACIRPDMSADEVQRRIRATTFGSWRPEVVLHGFRFRYQPDSD